MKYLSNLKKIRVQHVDRDAKGVEIKTDVDVITDADCITMDDGDLRSGVKKMIDNRIGAVIDGAPEELDTLKEIATELEKNQSGVSTILKKLEAKLDKSVFDEEAKGFRGGIVDLENAMAHNQDIIEELMEGDYEELEKEIELKVDKVEGKGLSTNDFTDADKEDINRTAAMVEIAANQVLVNSEAIGDLKEMSSALVYKTDIVDFKRCIVLSESNYSALSDAEKNRADTLYFLK